MPEWRRSLVRKSERGPSGVMHWCEPDDDEAGMWRFVIWKPRNEPYYLVDDDWGSAEPEDESFVIVDGPWPTLKEAKVRYLVKATTEGWAK